MRSLVLYVDGSRVLSADRRAQSFGWGLVALHDDEHHEKWGRHLGGKTNPLCGHHEQIAFVHGVLYAKSAGFDLRDVAVYTDCDSFGYAPSSLNPENYNQQGADKVMQRLHTVAAHAFDRSVVDVVLDAFALCRITKLKGHSQHVYQERCDYLARFAAQRGIDGRPEHAQPLSMEDWLARGLVDYVPALSARGESRYVRTTWRAPFVQAPA